METVSHVFLNFMELRTQFFSLYFNGLGYVAKSTNLYDSHIIFSFSIF